jgi:thiopeptide-type bacteriocin biosynthesis protein
MNQAHGKGKWTSFHLFYHGDLDLLLTAVLAPMLGDLLRDGIVQDWFFLRYWNGGPHIRLRVHTLHRAHVELAVKHAFETFCREYPANQVEAATYVRQIERMNLVQKFAGKSGFSGFEPVEALQPSGTMHTRTYKFDSARFGRGRVARVLTETHFCISSKMAVRLISRTQGNMVARLTVALHLVAAICPVFGIDLRTAENLLQKYAGMSSFLYSELGTDTFRNAGFLPFDEIQSGLSDLRQQLARGLPLSGQGKEVNAFVGLWQKEIEFRFAQLGQHRKPKLQPDPKYILMDYMHLMNNRLGLNITEECYLYDVVAKMLHSVSMSTPRASTLSGLEPGIADRIAVWHSYFSSLARPAK